MDTVCKKCGYKRQSTDQAPEYECPNCGAVYAKVEAHLERQAEEAERQKEIEETKRRIESHKKDAVKEKLIKENQGKLARDKAAAQAHKDRVVTKTYKGTQEIATAAFQADAIKMANEGYFPTSQSWAPGSYGCGAFLLALVLCFIIIGILVFIYMLIVKPAGTLSVTYELRETVAVQVSDEAADSKVCPRCAETIKAAAVVCRYCGHEFNAT